MPRSLTSSRWLGWRLPLVLMLALAGPAALHATQLRPLAYADLVARSAHVVIGVVEGQQATFTDATRSSIVTDVRVRVTRTLRGAPVGALVTVRTLGGTINGLGMRVAGEARFTVGEEVLLFAEQRGANLWAVGMTQGKLHIETLASGQKQVQGNLAGVELLPAAASVKAAAAAGPRPLDDVVGELTALLGASR